MKKLPVFFLVFLILMAMAVPGLAAYRVYRVQPRNTVSQIARLVRPMSLVQANRLPDPGFIIPPGLDPDHHRADEQLHLVKPGRPCRTWSGTTPASSGCWTVITCRGVPFTPGKC